MTDFFCRTPDMAHPKRITADNKAQARERFRNWTALMELPRGTIIVQEGERAKRYAVHQYAANGNYMGRVSGMGKNRGTWDSDHSRSAAYRHAAQCRKDVPYTIFKVEEA